MKPRSDLRKQESIEFYEFDLRAKTNQGQAQDPHEL